MTRVYILPNLPVKPRMRCLAEDVHAGGVHLDVEAHHVVT
jgi:hypothetical protein